MIGNHRSNVLVDAFPCTRCLGITGAASFEIGRVFFEAPGDITNTERRPKKKTENEISDIENVALEIVQINLKLEIKP